MTLNKEVTMRPTRSFAPGVEQPEIEFPKPGVGQIVADAFMLENTIPAIHGLMREVIDAESDAPPPEGFDPFEGIEGTVFEQVPMALAGVTTPEQKMRVENGLRDELERRERLSHAGLLGLVAMFGTGVVDPLILLPIGGQVRSARSAIAASKMTRAAKAGQLAKIAATGIVPAESASALTAGIVTARAGVIGGSASEMLLQADQDARTFGEGALNVTAGMVLGGIFGSAVGKMAQKSRKVALAQINDDMKVIAGGTSEFDSFKLTEKDLVQPTDGGASVAEIKLQSALGADRLATMKGLKTFSTPLIRILVRSHSRTYKKAIMELLDSPVKTEGYYPKSSVEGEILSRDAMFHQIVNEKDRLYTQYRTRMAKERGADGTLVQQGGRLRRNIIQATDAVTQRNRGTEILSPSEFSRRAGATSRSRDSGIAEVDEFGRFVDEKIYKPLLDDAIALEMLPEEVASLGPTGARRYLQRIYLKDKLIAKEGEFKSSKIKPWLYGVMDDDEIDAILKTAGFGKKDIKPSPSAKPPAEAAEARGEKAPRATNEERVSAIREMGVSDKLARNPDALVRSMLRGSEEGKVYDSIGAELGGVSHVAEAMIPEIAKTFSESGIKRGDIALESLIKKLSISQQEAAGANMGDPMGFQNVFPRPDAPAAIRFKSELRESILRRLDDEGLHPERRTEMAIDHLLPDDPTVKKASEARGEKVEAIGLDAMSPYSRRSFTPEQATAIDKAVDLKVHQIFENLTAGTRGRVDYDRMPAGKGSPFKARALTWSDDNIEEFLEQDIELLSEMYVRSVAPDIALVRKFGSVNPDDMKLEGEKILEKAGLEYADARANAKAGRLRNVEKQRQKIQQQQAWDKEQFADSVAVLRGVYHVPADNALTTASRGARAINYGSMGGGFGLNSFPDVGMPIMRNGLWRTFRTGYAPFITHLEATKMAKKELQLFSVAIDMATDTRSKALADIGNDFAQNRAQQAMQKFTSTMSLVNLMAPWNEFMKSITGTISMTRMIESILAEGKGAIAAKEIDNFNFVRLGPEMRTRIRAQLQRQGGMDDMGPVKRSNTTAWDDLEAVQEWGRAVRLSVDNTILTPGVGATPLWLNKEHARTIFQFQRFGFGATNSLFLVAAQTAAGPFSGRGTRGFLNTFNGLALMSGAGMLIEWSKNGLNDRKNPEGIRWVTAGIDRTGLLGIYGRMYNIQSKITGIGGGPLSSRYAARNFSSTLLGPTMGTVESGVKITNAAFQGELSDRELNVIRRLVPYNQVPYLQGGFDHFEDTLAESLGLPKKRKRRSSK